MNPEQGARFGISAKWEAAVGLGEPLDVVGEGGPVPRQDLGRIGGSPAPGTMGWDAVPVQGLNPSFKEQAVPRGSWDAEQSGHSLGGCTRVFLDQYIATCANLLELVN